MSIEAMKQALDALTYIYTETTEHEEKVMDEAIAVLEQAIAEAEKQEPVAWYGDADGFPVYPAPVHASDISQECVDKTAKCKHDLWIAAACLKSTVESAIKAGDWKVDGACDPTRDLAYLANCLANPKREWTEQPDLARVGEVGVWGDKREWVGLTDEEVHDAFNFVEFVKQVSFDRDRPEWCENFAAYLEAKLKEKNT